MLTIISVCIASILRIVELGVIADIDVVRELQIPGEPRQNTVSLT